MTRLVVRPLTAIAVGTAITVSSAILGTAAAQNVREQLKYEEEVPPYHGGVRYFERNGRQTIEIDVPKDLPANTTLDDWMARKAAEEYVKYVKRVRERDPAAIVGPPAITIQRVIRGRPVS